MDLRALAGDTARRLGFQVDLTEEHIAQPASEMLLPTDRPRAISILQTSREALRKLGWTAEGSQLDDLLKNLAEDQPGGEENPPP